MKTLQTDVSSIEVVNLKVYSVLEYRIGIYESPAENALIGGYSVLEFHASELWCLSI